MHWSETMTTLLHTAFLANSRGWWSRIIVMFAFKARAYCNTIDVILFSYGCLQHWNLWIRDTSYMAIYDVSFLVRMFHKIILHPNIYSDLSVPLYWVTTSVSLLCKTKNLRFLKQKRAYFDVCKLLSCPFPSMTEYVDLLTCHTSHKVNTLTKMFMTQYVDLSHTS